LAKCRQDSPGRQGFKHLRNFDTDYCRNAFIVWHPDDRNVVQVVFPNDAIDFTVLDNKRSGVFKPLWSAMADFHCSEKRVSLLEKQT